MNQPIKIPVKYPKFVKTTNKKTYYKTLGTSVTVLSRPENDHKDRANGRVYVRFISFLSVLNPPPLQY